MSTLQYPAPDTAWAKTVIKNLATLYIGLSRRPFTNVGGLTTTHGATVVGPVVRHNGVYGIYATSRDFHLARIDKCIDNLSRAPPGSIRGRLCCFLAALEARSLVETCAEMGVEEPTYLKHMDLDTQNIVVSEDGAAVIDWEL